MVMYKKITSSLAIAAVVIALQGCSKVTKANYERIEMGMIKSDVEMVLGEPTECESVIGTYSCIWGEPDGKHIKINFIGNRAAVFSHKGLEE